jgi:DNA-binding beta-propeller fold protein YncE
MVRLGMLLVMLQVWQMPSRGQALKLVAGGGDGPDGSPAKTAKLTAPFGVDFDKAGTMYFVEMTGHRVRKVSPDGILTTVAGDGTAGFAGDGGPAAKARLNGPHSLAVAPNGEVYVADTWNNRVRKIDPKTGGITTVVGRGPKGFSGDGGPASEAGFGGIYCVAFDPKGERLYMADLDNRRIRVLNLKTGTVTTVAGNGEKGVPRDGTDARSSPLVDPRAVAADVRGNIYILERGGHALRVVDRAGKVRTLVGNGRPGDSGDGGDGRQAQLRGPKHLCVDRAGDVIIADSDNHRVRKLVTRDETIHPVVGTGRPGRSGLGGPPESAELNQPHGVYLHASGVLYISDSSNDRILKIER